MCAHSIRRAIISIDRVKCSFSSLISFFNFNQIVRQEVRVRQGTKGLSTQCMLFL